MRYQFKFRSQGQRTESKISHDLPVQRILRADPLNSYNDIRSHTS